MQAKKIPTLQIFNALGMWEFEILKLEDEILLIRAHRGHPQYFWVEIVFQGVEYLACPIFFFDRHLRLATTQETPLVEKHQAVTVYCFEEIPPSGGTHAEPAFIAARSVELTVYYSGENLDEILQRVSGDKGNTTSPL